jgi:hypothetical protein
MYENSFLYLFDVKKLTSLNYDNLKKYYVNLEGFLKPNNFFYLDDIQGRSQELFYGGLKESTKE